MRTIILASAAVLALGAGAAYAGDGEGVQPNTFFTELPGVIAQAPVAQVPSSVAQAQQPAGAPTAAFVTSHNSGTWLFAPNGNAGATN